MIIKFVDLNQQYKSVYSEILSNIKNCIANGQFVGGYWVDGFQKDFAKFHDIEHCVGVGSGTDALWLALLALGIGPGDEVLVPANTFIATALAVTHTGAKVVFVEVDPHTYNIDYEYLDKYVTPKTKAVIPVHLYGNPVEMDGLMLFAKEHNLKVVEDCAQAIGATFNDQPVGTFGDVGCFSFYPTKNLGGLGQGGAIITRDKKIADKIESMANVGRKKGSHYEYVNIGFNSRLDSINALFLDICLKEVRSWNLYRQSIARLYNTVIDGIPQLSSQKVLDVASNVYHLFELKCPDKTTRDTLKLFLDTKDIATGLHYPIPCHKQPIYSDHSEESFPVAEYLSESLLSLPMYPTLPVEDATVVVSAIKEFFEASSVNRSALRKKLSWRIK